MNKRWLELSVGAVRVAGIAALVALALQVSGGSISAASRESPDRHLWDDCVTSKLTVSKPS